MANHKISQVICIQKSIKALYAAHTTRLGLCWILAMYGCASTGDKTEEMDSDSDSNYANEQSINNQGYNDYNYNNSNQNYAQNNYGQNSYSPQTYNQGAYNQGNYNYNANQDDYAGNYNQNTQANYGAPSENNFDASATAPVTENELRGNNTNSANSSAVNMFGNSAGYEAADNVAKNSQNTAASISESTPEPSAQEGADKSTEEPESGEIIAADKQGDVLPSISELSWVGYDYRPEEAVIRVEMLTKGVPKYALFRAENQHKQPEVVVRFYQTQFGKRISRDIDATEFSAPVSYIRMFYHELDHHTDVIITLRELSSMRLFAEEGNLLAIFTITDKYYGNHSVEPLDLAYAENMAKDSYVEFFPTSDLPKGVAPMDLTAGVFRDVSSKEGVQIYDVANNDVNYSSEGLPTQNFHNGPVLEMEQRNYPPESLPESIYNQPPLYNTNDTNSSSMIHKHQHTKKCFDSCRNNQAFVIERSGYLTAIAQNEADAFYAADDTPPPSNDLFGNQSAELYENSEAITPEANNAVGQEMPYNDGDYVDVSSEEETGYDNKEVALSDTSQNGIVGHPVTLEFKEAPLAHVLNLLASENDLNFVYDHAAHKGKTVTMSLKNIAWQTALEAVLNVHGLGYSPIGGKDSRIIKIEQAKKAAIKPQGIDGVDKELLLIRLSYIKAAEAIKIISKFIKTNTSSSSSAATPAAGAGTASETAPAPAPAVKQEYFNVVEDKRTNTIIVEGTPDVLSRVKSLVERLDTQTPQVQISARIVEMSKNRDDNYGIRWDKAFNLSRGTGVNLGSLGIAGINGGFAVDTDNPRATATRLDFNLDTLTSINAVNLALQWHERHLDARILQNTSVMVLDNEKATIESGVQDTISFSGGINSEGGTKDISYTLKLEVTPQVTSDGSVNLQVTVNSDDPVDNAGTNRKSTKKVETNLIRASGETAAIAGVYTQSDNSGSQNVPLLSHLPIVGWLFKNSDRSVEKKEIVIFLTPIIMNFQALSQGGTLASGDSSYNNYNNYAYNDDNAYNNNYAYNNNQANNYAYNQNTNYNYENNVNNANNYNQNYDYYDESNTNDYGYENDGNYNNSNNNKYNDYYNQSYDQNDFANNSENNSENEYYENTSNNDYSSDDDNYEESDNQSY